MHDVCEMKLLGIEQCSPISVFEKKERMNRGKTSSMNNSTLYLRGSLYIFSLFIQC